MLHARPVVAVTNNPELQFPKPLRFFARDTTRYVLPAARFFTVHLVDLPVAVQIADPTFTCVKSSGAFPCVVARENVTDTETFPAEDPRVTNTNDTSGDDGFDVTDVALTGIELSRSPTHEKNNKAKRTRDFIVLPPRFNKTHTPFGEMNTEIKHYL